MNRLLSAFLFFFLSFSQMTIPAYAGDGRNLGLIFRGVAKTVGAVFEIPKAMLVDSTQVMFPFGLLTGAVNGTFRTVGGAVGGALDMARGAAPYAKYLIFL